MIPFKIPGLEQSDDGKSRCQWCVKYDDYRQYHDREWGRPVMDDTRLFEKICLEGFQAGLSWLTILRKRENFRAAFDGFDIDCITHYTERDVGRLLDNAGIVRHRGKIESTINNAHQAQRLIKEYGSLANFFWAFEPPELKRPQYITYHTVGVLSKTETSSQLSRTLKKHGWSFVGPTTVYAFMQAMGLVNDHLEGCVIRDSALAERKRMQQESNPSNIPFREETSLE